MDAILPHPLMLRCPTRATQTDSILISSIITTHGLRLLHQRRHIARRSSSKIRTQSSTVPHLPSLRPTTRVPPTNRRRPLRPMSLLQMLQSHHRRKLICAFLQNRPLPPHIPKDSHKGCPFPPTRIHNPPRHMRRRLPSHRCQILFPSLASVMLLLFRRPLHSIHTIPRRPCPNPAHLSRNCILAGSTRSPRPPIWFRLLSTAPPPLQTQPWCPLCPQPARSQAVHHP